MRGLCYYGATANVDTSFYNANGAHGSCLFGERHREQLLNIETQLMSTLRVVLSIILLSCAPFLLEGLVGSAMADSPASTFRVATSNPNVDQVCFYLPGSTTPVCDRQVNKTTGAISATPSFLGNIPGAVGDGVTNDEAAIETAAASLGTKGGTIRLDPLKSYYVPNLIIPANVTIEGGLQLPDNPGGSNATIAYGALGGINLASTGTIAHGANAGLDSVLVRRAGMAFPASDASAFAGQAITWTADGVHDRNVMTLGFGMCVGESGATVSRYIVEKFYCDGVSGELINKPSYDSSIIRDVHNWPFSSAQYTTQAALTRSGTGLALGSAQDDTRVDNVLSYGFATDFNFTATGAISVGKIWADYDGAYAAGSSSVCVNVGAGTTGIHIDQLWAWSCAQGLVAQMDAGTRLTIGQLHVRSTASHGVTVAGGDIEVGALDMTTTGGYGFDITAASSYVAVRGGQASAMASGFVAMPTGATLDHYDFTSVKTDLPNGGNIYTNSATANPSIASADPLLLSPNYDKMTVTGTTSFGNIAGGYGGRVIYLQFASPLTVYNGAEIHLAGSANLTVTAGTILGLMYDTTANQFREVSRALP